MMERNLFRQPVFLTFLLVLGISIDAAPYGNLWADQSSAASNKQSRQSDVALENAVKKRLNFEPRLNPIDIKVSVQNGNVALSGIVDNLLDKEQARQFAQEVPGVASVTEDLKVRQVERNDADIKKEITDFLTVNPSVNGGGIKVNVRDRVVALNGTVGSNEEKESADTTAKNVDGVKGVVNNLQVARRDGPSHADRQ